MHRQSLVHIATLCFLSISSSLDRCIGRAWFTLSHLFSICLVANFDGPLKPPCIASCLAFTCAARLPSLVYRYPQNRWLPVPELCICLAGKFLNLHHVACHRRVVERARSSFHCVQVVVHFFCWCRGVRALKTSQ